MTLEFKQLIEQIYRMSAMIDAVEFEIEEKLEYAYRIFETCDDVPDALRHIEWVRQPDISGYRGAAPSPLDQPEPINLFVPPPPMPAQASIIAVDGSQIFPDEMEPVHYYLLNFGAFTYFHGLDRAPEQFVKPELLYHEAYVHDRYDRLIHNSVVGDRRTLGEMQLLGKLVWEGRKDENFPGPIVALYDNRLLFMPGEPARKDENFLRDYWSAFQHLRDGGAILAGYIDNTYISHRFIQLLFLMSLKSYKEVKLNQHLFSQGGLQMQGLRDQQFFQAFLPPGHRSAVMVQNSPQNAIFAERNPAYEIAFFYLKVANAYMSRVIRVDIPIWVANDPGAVDTLHALLLQQCQMQGRNPYPYAISRADELAVVKHTEAEKLRQLIRQELRKKGVRVSAFSAKTYGKQFARSEKRKHTME
ncbi:DNA double-strand break repair nuclease NurA [Anaerolineales bacterium]